MLAHQLQNPLDIVELQSPSVSRQDQATLVGHEHIVFNADAADAFNVNTRLDREHHARLKHQIRMSGEQAPDPRFFVDLQPEPVPRPMAEGVS
jgi:hypothetical protein